MAGVAGVSANRLELLQIADAVAREKTIDRKIVIQAMEDAIQKAAKSRYGAENDIRCEIDPKTGETRLTRVLAVVDAVENEVDADHRCGRAASASPRPKLGDLIAESLPPLDFGRVAAQNAKQVIVQKVREAERDRQFGEYKDRIGEIVNGTVKRAEYGNVIVDLGPRRGHHPPRRDDPARERALRRPHPRLHLRRAPRAARPADLPVARAAGVHGQAVRAGSSRDLRRRGRDQVGAPAIPAAAPRSRFAPNDSSIDPVGACVGMRGARVQAVVNELQGEKVDIIQWNPDAASFIVNALAPAEVSKVVLDEDSNRIEVVVPESQLSLAIGRRGQNVRLASQLTGWDIDIMTEQEESERRQKEFAERSQAFMDALDVDEVIAQLLVTEGFASVEEVAYVDLSEIAHIEGFDENTAGEIQTRAREYLEKQEAERDAKRRELGVADDLAKVEGVTTAMLVAFGENGIKTLEDLADCATDDLVGWTERSKEKDVEPVRHKGVLDGFELDRKEAEDMIMSARVLAGWITAEESGRAGQRGRDGEEALGCRGLGGRLSRELPREQQERCRIWRKAVESLTESMQTRARPKGPAIVCARLRAPSLTPDELIRFVADPAARSFRICPAAFPGRGVWITAEKAVVAEAIKAKVFARSLKRQVKVAEDLADRVEALLVQAGRRRLYRSPTRPASSPRDLHRSMR